MGEPESLTEFFDSRGAVSLFCVINPAGSRFEELVEAMLVARATVKKRLDEAQAFGLVNKEVVEGEQGSPLRMWMPTERGMEVVREVKAREIDLRFEEYRRAYHEFEDKVDAFEKYVERKNDSYWEQFDDSPVTDGG